MKIEACVISVSDHGDKLSVEMQGKGVAEANWAAMCKQTLLLQNNVVNRRAYHVGRAVTITVNCK